MNVNSAIQALLTQIAQSKERLKWLRKNRKKLADLPDGYMYGERLDFDTLPHAEVIKVVKALGGKWKKSKNGAKEGRVDYEQKIGPVEVRCWAGEPPPSCRMVEVEEEVPEQIIPAKPEEIIPAHKVKRFKMICTPGNEPVVEAIGRAINNNPSANIERTDTV